MITETKQEVIVRTGDLTLADAEEISQKSVMGIDTETTGLDPTKDKLQLVQIATDDKVYVVREPSENSTHLRSVLTMASGLKIAHYWVFDLSFLIRHLKILRVKNIFCTKIADKLTNPGELHGLGECLKKHLGVVVDKSLINEARVGGKFDWSKLTDKQLQYAADDVRYLAPMQRKQADILNEKNIYEIAYAVMQDSHGQAMILAYGLDKALYAHR